MAALILAPGLVALICCAVGASRREAPILDPAVIVIAGLGVALGLAYAINGHSTGVSTADYALGLVLSSLLFTLPSVGCYALGRRVDRPAIFWPIFVLSLAALYVYLFIGLLWTADLVHCPPDAYECPL
jgi:hypothetical protein